MSRQALELALEALEESQQILDEYATEFIFTRQKNNDAIATIKEALAQPQRTWVGLTDEERKDIELGIEVFAMSVEDILKETEAKLKEKNHDPSRD